MKKILLITLLAAFVAVNCSKVPYTNRTQFSLIPDATITSMAATQYTQFLDTMKLSTNAAATKQLKEVGVKISSAVEKYLRENGMENRIKEFKWEYNLVESNEINAWCMPGGKICFYTGILPYTKDADGIATVMSHEIAHAVARHGSERMTQQIAQQAGGLALSEFIKQKPQQTQTIFLTGYAITSQYGVILPYSRKHEFEADELGLIFMSMAGYNPEKAVDFWTRMSQNSSSNTPQFLSTHPSNQARIDNLKKVMPKAMEFYKKGVK